MPIQFDIARAVSTVRTDGSIERIFFCMTVTETDAAGALIASAALELLCNKPTNPADVRDSIVTWANMQGAKERLLSLLDLKKLEKGIPPISGEREEVILNATVDESELVTVKPPPLAVP